MKTGKSIVFLLLCFPLFVMAQGTEPEGKGKPILKIFSNFHSGLGKNLNETAFEITRAYLGYNYQIDNHYSIEAKLDIGSPNDESQYSLLRRYAYFKTANLKYSLNKLSIRFGLIGSDQFKHQEKDWGKRYLYKSFMDEHRFGPSADIGTSLNYQAFSWLSFNIALTNGEGYKQLQMDDIYKIGGGISISPIKDLHFYAYCDFMKNQVWQSTQSFYINYKYTSKASLSLEYNIKNNKDYLAGYKQFGWSAYAHYYISPKIQLFGRYDRLQSNMVEDFNMPWNIVNDGTAIVAGLQFQPIKNVSIALNYQDWYPLAQNMDNRSYIYLSLEFKI